MTRRSEHPPADQVDPHLVQTAWTRLTASFGVPSVWALQAVSETTGDLLRGIQWSDRLAHLFRLVQWTDGLVRRELLRGPHAWPEDQVDRVTPWSSELTEHCISLIRELERIALEPPCPVDLSKTATDP